MLKRGYYGTYHQMSAKHLSRYVGEFAGRHNDCPRDTIDQMRAMVRGHGGQARPLLGSRCLATAPPRR